MDYPLLQVYRSGTLRCLWEEKTQVLAKANPTILLGRIGEIMAAMLAHDLGLEISDLSGKVRPFTMAPEEVTLYDWLYVEEHTHFLADLQEWSGSRTLLADTPIDDYEPEWMNSIQRPAQY